MLAPGARGENCRNVGICRACYYANNPNTLTVYLIDTYVFIAGFTGTTYISEEHRRGDIYLALSVQNSSSAILKGRVSLGELELRNTPAGAFGETVGKSHIIVSKIAS